MSEQKTSERKKAQNLKAKLTFPIYPELWAVDPTPVGGSTPAAGWQVFSLEPFSLGILLTGET